MLLIVTLMTVPVTVVVTVAVTFTRRVNTGGGGVVVVLTGVVGHVVPVRGHEQPEPQQQRGDGEDSAEAQGHRRLKAGCRCNLVAK